MDTSTLKIFCLFLLSIFHMTEISGKNNRIKIIVPHKISIIHHHHSRIADLKPKKKPHFEVHDLFKSNQIHEEESEEDSSEEGHFGHYRGETDEEASKGVAYYTLPTSAYSNAVRVYMKPVFLYNNSHDRKRLLPSQYHKYEDYYYPEDAYLENGYRVRGFLYK